MTQQLDQPAATPAPRVAGAIAFAYQAQTLEGQSISGTIDAADLDAARRTLAAMRLRVITIEPAGKPQRGKPIRGDDFAAFNQQLAHLTSAGMPIEHGLKLIARDMRRGRLSATIQQLASEMERGTPLDQAFEKFQDRFPPLYARLVAAGVKAGDLPGMLLNLGRHMELVQRLRAALWRTLAYPLMVLAGLVLVVLFLGYVVIPQFRLLFRDMGYYREASGLRLPWATKWLLSLPSAMPYIIIFLAAVVVACVFAAILTRTRGGQAAARDRFLLPLPLIGPILRNNLIARWCDAVRLGVRAGLDLPRSIELGTDSVASPRLRHDAAQLIAALQEGKAVDTVKETRLLPPTVPAAMALAGEDLAATLATLSQMYQQQAEMRLALLPGILTPILVVLMAGVIGCVIAALFLPFLQLLSMLM
jgi:type IV pilus assembly protein PilC